jgi:Holliday junction resolvasome RuvABC endonuclease subunit
MTPLPVLALDLSSKATGWCVISETGINGGWRGFIPRGSNLTTLERHCRIFDSFGDWLTDVVDEHQPAVLVLEDYVIRFPKSAAVSLGLRAIALLIAHRREILVDVMTPSEWRRVAATLGWAGTKSDQGDAEWLAAAWVASERAAA